MEEISRKIEWKTGKVKFFDNNKGFGFINCWDDKEDYFVHISCVGKDSICENNIVIFNIGPSRKKSLEVKNIFLIENFLKDPIYLMGEYLKYSDEFFRKKVLQCLPVQQIISLLENEINSFHSVDNEVQFIDFQKAIKLFTSINRNNSIKDAITNSISKKVNEISSQNFKIKFWVEGISNIQPDEELIFRKLETSNKKELLDIFNVAKYPVKEEFIKKFLLQSTPRVVIEFIVEHLKKINKIEYYFDIKPKLFDKKYWEKKCDYGLFQNALKLIQETYDDQQKLDLFLDGYLSSISMDYLLSVFCELSTQQIDQVFQNVKISKTEKSDLAKKLMDQGVQVFLNSIKNNEQTKTQDLLNGDDVNFKLKTEHLKWVLNISTKFIAEKEFSWIEISLQEKLPIFVHFFLWENGFLKTIPDEAISKLMLSSNLIPFNRIYDWLERGSISKIKLIEIIKSNLQSDILISNREQYYALENQIQILSELGIDLFEMEQLIPLSTLWYFKLSLWINGKSSEFNFEEFKSKLVFLNPDDQIKFLKKLFLLAHTNQFDLTVQKLTQLTRIDFDIFAVNEQYHPEIPLDISVDIVIEVLKSIHEKGEFLLESEILKIVIKDLTLNKKYKFKIRGFFENCMGRNEPDYTYWPRNGEVKKVFSETKGVHFVISFDYDNELVQEVKKIPYREWIPAQKSWEVPMQSFDHVIQFAKKNRFFIDLGENHYLNNTHFAQFKRIEIPQGITYCEGRPANKIHETFNLKFWWCCNQPCFNNCETIHSTENWIDYTLLDFLNIMGIELGDYNRVGDFIEKGKYYQFISTINRFNRLLDRLYCKECNNILYPVEDSHFAHYRVVRFQCENKNCSQKHNEIYLHHCLNAKCNWIIDSRISKKCPNGLYICSNKNCGCCCSHSMLERRLNNLNTSDLPNTPAKQFIISDLTYKVKNKLGHLERAQHFCYKCEKMMEDLENDVFKCNNCQVTYDVSTNKFKRPNKHLKSGKIDSDINTTPGYNDIY